MRSFPRPASLPSILLQRWFLLALLGMVGLGTWSAPSPLPVEDGNRFGQLEHIREAGLLSSCDPLYRFLRQTQETGDDGDPADTLPAAAHAFAAIAVIPRFRLSTGRFHPLSPPATRPQVPRAPPSLP